MWPPETQLLRALPLALFVILGLRVPRARDPARRRARVRQLLMYTLVVHVAVGLTQSEAWPFSPHRQMAVDSRNLTGSSMIAFRGVDGQGREWPIDPQAWSPLFPPSAMAWVMQGLPRAGDARRREALAFLLSRAEAARRARRSGLRFGQGRLLGPWAAPDIFVHREPEPAPEPFAALRIYELRWLPRALAADHSRYERRLLTEYPGT